MKTKFIGVTGIKKSGKTTTIEYLVPLLKKEGYNVGNVKIAFKEVSIDINEEHYDVIRHRNVKPDKTLFKSKIETVIYYNDQLSLKNALLSFSNGLDIVLIEGFKEDLEGIPQIVLINERDQEKHVTDDYTTAISSIPEFSIKSKDPRFVEFEQLIEICEKKALPLFPSLDCGHCGFKNCNLLIKDILAGKKEILDCDVLASEIGDVVLKVNNQIVHCNPFVQDILKNIMKGFLTTLKMEEKEIKDVFLELKYTSKEEEEK